MERIEIVILAESEERLIGLAAALEADGDLVATCLSDPGALAPRIASRRPAAMVVLLGEKAQLFLDAVESLPTPRPALLALGSEDDGKAVLRAMRLGAHQYLPEDIDTARLRASLAEAGLPDADGEREVGAGHVVGVLGAKGGVGATLVASQLTLALRKLGASTTMVDLNLRYGDAALYLDLQPVHSLADLEREGPLDSTWLRTVLQGHPSGAQLLAAPAQPENADLVDAVRVGEALGIARKLADWTVIDLARDFGEVSLRALDLCDELILVTSLGIPSLHHARSLLSLVDRLGMDPSRIHLVLNRAGQANQASESDVRAFLGRRPDARLPDDPAAAQETANYGRSLLQAAPGSALCTGMGELAALLHEWRGLPRPAIERPAGPVRAALGRLRSRTPWR